jgi:6-phosphogluconate dehydrogenase
MELGYIGLGKMGKNMVRRILEHGVSVVAWNRSPEPLEEVEKAGATIASDVADMVKKLKSPRLIWVMLPQGEVVDRFVDELSGLLEKNDVVIDGGNSFFKDTLKRSKKLESKGISLMDVGTSGGPSGAKEGACLMIGGPKRLYQKYEGLFKIIAAPNAYQYLGRTGAGHFAKMVHNGIEYGMMQAIAEGAAILEKSDFDYNLSNVFSIYNNRSVIESRLVEWTKKAFDIDAKLTNISSIINHTGEGEWTINTAKEMDIEVPVIKSSYEVRVNSADQPDNFRNKVVSAMRGQFGGHQVKKD